MDSVVTTYDLECSINMIYTEINKMNDIYMEMKKEMSEMKEEMRKMNRDMEDMREMINGKEEKMGIYEEGAIQERNT